MPYYKWSFRALRDLKILSDLEAPLYDLMTKGNEPEHVKDKYFTIEEIAQKVINVLYDQGITKASCGDLEKHAYSVNDMITDSAVRNLNILYAV